MMMNFCKKSVHAFLGLPTTIDTTSPSSNTVKLPYHVSSSLSGGLGLVTATDGDVQRSPNVLESSSVKSTVQFPSLPPAAPPKKDLIGSIGFIDDMGGGVDGLMSCTESLGFESSDERRFDDKIAEAGMFENDGNSCSFQYRRTTPRMKYWTRKQAAGGEVKKFPPPLSSLKPNGQRNFFLRAVRKEGRLELTEVRIDRTEVLWASRQDGRLRLQLIRDCAEEVEDENRVVQQEVDQPEQEEVEEEEEEKKVEVVVKNEEKENVKGRIEDHEEKEEEKLFGEWKFPVSGEGFRWCHELAVSHGHEHHHLTNHHLNLHAWRQHCVTTG